MGMYYLNESKEEKDKSLAKRMLESAASNGHSQAQVELGLCYIQEEYGSIEEAVVQWICAAKKGNRDACYYLACYYETQLQKMPYLEKMIENLLMAKELGHPLAVKKLKEFFKFASHLSIPMEELNLNHLRGLVAITFVFSRHPMLVPEHSWSGLDCLNHSLYGQDYMKIGVDSGDMIAEIALGILYRHTGNEKKGFELFESAAKKGLLCAYAMVGNSYLHGIGVEKNLPKALEIIHHCASRNDAISQYDLAKYYISDEDKEKDYKKAFEYLVSSSNQNYYLACDLLGVFYENGTGVEKDLQKAVQCYTKAANGGNPEAQMHLGLCYYHGKGVEKNISKSIEFFQLCASRNNLKAQHILANCYLNGVGVEKNINHALDLFFSSANQGDVDSQLFLARYYCKNRSLGEMAKDKIFYFSQLAAQKGNPEAQEILSFCYITGTGTKKDIQRGINIALYLADHGCYSKSQYQIADWYQRGVNLERNLAKAHHYFLLAAKNGHSGAQYRLGQMYEFGQYVEKNIPESLRWYDCAAKQDHPQAKARLQENADLKHLNSSSQ